MKDISVLTTPMGWVRAFVVGIEAALYGPLWLWLATDGAGLGAVTGFKTAKLGASWPMHPTELQVSGPVVEIGTAEVGSGWLAWLVTEEGGSRGLGPTIEAKIIEFGWGWSAEFVSYGAGLGPVIGAETEEIGMSCSAWLPKGELGTLGLDSAVGAGAALGRTRFKVIGMAFH
jgi:hypothetical protein